MSDRAYVTTHKGLFTIDRTSAGWRLAGEAFVGVPSSMFLHDPRDGTLYAALGHGHFGAKMHRSRDGGDTWEECPVPAYPEKPADAPEINCPVRGTPIPWSLEMVWSLAAGGEDEPGALWCGTIPGGLFRSEDGGDSWELVRSLWEVEERAQWFGGGYDYPGIHSICVDPRDSRHVSVGISCGGVWVTRDRGETWSCRADGMRANYTPPEEAYNPAIQDPHLMVRCAAQPDAYWVQHHNGIFRSVDDCESWTEIDDAGPSTFGFAVAVHPAEPGTAWFVPAASDVERVPVDQQIVVTRTRDDGHSFDVLREGLPQADAYDLAYRHALDVDESGDRLMFGSTTGSLWVSENQGDSWTTITQNLPPIKCVNFVNAA